MFACSWILLFIISTTTATAQISKYLYQRHKDKNITLRTVYEEKSEVDASDNIQKLVNEVKNKVTPQISKYLNQRHTDKNITLKTVDDEKSEADTDSDNIQKLVNEVKNKFYRSNQDKTIAASNNYKNTVTFFDFIQEVIELLNKFDDTDLENVFSIANAEIKQYDYRGCKFHELTENVEFRNHIAKTLEENRRKTATDIRNNLRIVSEGLKNDKLNRYIKMMIDSINTLYKDESVGKFNKFLTNLDEYRQKARRNMDLVKIIRSGIRSVIFDYYSNLDHHMRSEFRSNVNEFWSNYIRKSTIPLVKEFAKALMNDVDKKKSKKSTVKVKTTKLFKKKSKKLPSHNYKKINIEEKYVSKDNVDAYDRIFQIDDINNSNTRAPKSLRIETSKQSLQIPWEDFEKTYDAILEPNPSQPGHPTVVEVITMRPYVSKRALTSQKFKYEIHFKHDIREPKLHLKNPEFQIKHRVHIRKPNEPMEIYPPLFTESSIKYINEKKKNTKKLKQATQRLYRLPSTTRKYKRVLRADPAAFNDKSSVQHRRNFDNVSVIKRLQYLEDALKVAQTQIRNDSKIIKDLNSLLANQKIDYNVKYTVKPTTEENKNLVIDLKINIEDLKKIVNVPFNEIKQDEIKTALLKKLNIENHDNTDSNIGTSNIARKFDFDQHLYNSSRLKGKEIKISLSKRKNNTVSKDSSPIRGYLTDGDTYERLEDRVYDSDSNKGEAHYSDKKKRLQELKKQNNYKEVTVTSEKKTTVDANKLIMNQNKNGNYRSIPPYITLKHKMELNIDETNKHALSSDDELDEVETHDDGLKRKNESDYEIEKKLNENLYTTRLDKDSNNEYKKQMENENSSNKETDNINHDYYLDKKGMENILNYGLSTHDKNGNSSSNGPTNYYPDSHNNKNNVETSKNNEANKNLDSDFKISKNYVVSFQSNKPITTTGTLVSTAAVTQKDEIEFQIDNENAKFEKTEDPSRGNPKRFSMASPKANEVIGSTDIVAIYPTKILKFATRIP